MINLLHMLVRKGLPALCLFIFSASGLMAQIIHFEALPGNGGKASTSACVRIDESGTIASVVELRSDPARAELHVGEKKFPLTFVVNNLESRVAIYRLPDGAKSSIKEISKLGSSHDLKPAQSVFTSSVAREKTSRVVGRVHRFQGKVLPLAVLRVNHPEKVPLPGSGIYNADGQLVGMVRQAVHNNPNSSYCLPAEVISRVMTDHKRNGRVSRCWIGIIMDELVAPPIVESVRPDSPAKKVGLQSGDVILSIGGRQVKEYAEVVDAFFYLIAGESKKFRILRGTKVLELNVTPEVSPGR